MKRALLKLERKTLDDTDRPLKGDERRSQGKHKGTRGGPHRTTEVLKDAIIYAAQSIGEDGQGLNGLVGFLRKVAREEPRTYAMLLAKIIPLQVQTTKTTEVTYRSIDEVKAELEARGIPVDRIYH